MLNIFKIHNFVREKNEAGFTLIELLIVIVVLGILMSMAVPALSGVKNKADTAVAKADLHNIMHSLEMYYLDNGKYPADIKSLDDLNIKNEAADYKYAVDADSEKYSISYEDTFSNEFYYIKTDESSLIGPVDSVPSLATDG